jgi:carbonic anhydrase
MRKASLALLIMVLLTSLATPALGAAGGAGMSPDEALGKLKEGNERFVAGQPRHPNQGRERRALTAGQGQHPFAALLSCSDSRVPPELIFDQGLGDLLVVRVAGNVAQTDEIGTLEYAVDHLAIPLVVVMGHSQCGAVTVVVENSKVPTNVANLLAPIKPAVAKAKAENPEAAKEALVAAAVKDNVFQAMEDLLQKSAMVKNQAKAKKVKVVGALYDLDTGQVQWLGAHPDQDRLLGGKAKGPAAGQPAKKKKAKAESEED